MLTERSNDVCNFVAKQYCVLADTNTKNRSKSYDLLLFFGATDPIRTDDLLITSELLYLLSHSSGFSSEQTQYSNFAPIHQEKFAKEKQILCKKL